MDTSLEDFIGLNRPEYAGSGEAVLSSLAWSLVKNAEGFDPNIYESAQEGNGKARKFEVFPTRRNGAAKVVEAARCEGITFGNFTGIEDAFLDVFRGVLPAKAVSIPAVPIVASAAFLQDTRGAKGKKNPANYAQIIERFYCLGSSAAVQKDASAQAWYAVLSAGERIHVLKVLESLAKQMGPTREKGNVVESPSLIPPGHSDLWSSPRWIHDLNTPFHWFHRSWNNFCKLSWRNALPRRRWADWATCLLRTALGMCYLWEARFYRELARSLATGAEAEALPLGGHSELLNWIGHDAKVSVRDVSTRIRQDIAIADKARKEVNQLLPSEDDRRREILNMTYTELVAFLRAEVSKADQNPFSAMLTEEVKGEAPNTRETVVYSLQCRSETGADADYYSLLARRSRRYLVVEPGPEWIVVIASMAAGEPGIPTTLGGVNKELKSLGLNPPREVLVGELERAGMARSSHDADEAIEVVPAFEAVTL